MKTLKRILDFLLPWRYMGTVIFERQGRQHIASVYLNRWTGAYHSFE